jgi:hypothetical protein
MSVKGHLSEKDGILACLLTTEEVTACGAGLGEQMMSLSVAEPLGRVYVGKESNQDLEVLL